MGRGRAVRATRVVAFVVLFPMYVTLVGAFEPRDEVLRNRLLPTSLTLQTFADAWTEGHLGRYLFNSAVVGSR